MSRQFFSTTARSLFRIFGLNVHEIPESHREAFKTFTRPGGSAEQKLGTINEVYVKSRNGNPVHLSHSNPADKNPAISVRVTGSKDTKTCHIYADGTGTTKKTDGQE